MGKLSLYFGLPLSFLAWLIVGHFVSGLATTTWAFLAGSAAAFFVWRYFRRQDAKQLWALLNPEAITYDASLPVVWGSIQDVLSGATIISAAHLSGWHIVQQDESRGLMSATITFSELLGTFVQFQPVNRVIMLRVQMKPVGGKTEVLLRWQIHSPMNWSKVVEVIQETSRYFDAAIKANMPEAQAAAVEVEPEKPSTPTEFASQPTQEKPPEKQLTRLQKIKKWPKTEHFRLSLITGIPLSCYLFDAGWDWYWMRRAPLGGADPGIFGAGFVSGFFNDTWEFLRQDWNQFMYEHSVAGALVRVLLFGLVCLGLSLLVGALAQELESFLQKRRESEVKQNG